MWPKAGVTIKYVHSGAGGVHGGGRAVPRPGGPGPRLPPGVPHLAGLLVLAAGRPAPQGTRRRGAAPPFVPLARLDDPGTGPVLAAALRDRAAGTDVRTVNRELSALRSAVAWWQDQRWISRDPTEGLRHVAGPPPPQPVLTGGQLTRLFQVAPSLREHALWRVLHDSAAPADEVLRLDVGSLDLIQHRGRRAPSGPGQWIRWGAASTELLRWLTAGRPEGPVFLTSRRAPAGTPRADVCPLTGRARLSYRRAAEVFTEVTRPLDPAAGGWTLTQLRPADPRPGRSS